MAKKKWAKRVFKLKRDHGWTCRDGYNIFVADRGAVRFDYPRGWPVAPGENGSIKITDRKPPDDDCAIEVSVFHLNPDVDWSGLKLGPMVAELTQDGDLDVLERGEVVEESRGDMELAHIRTRFLERVESREAYSHTLVARRWTIQPLVTFCYWVDDAARFEPVWRELLASLVLGDYVEDPTQRLNDV